MDFGAYAGDQLARLIIRKIAQGRLEFRKTPTDDCQVYAARPTGRSLLEDVGLSTNIGCVSVARSGETGSRPITQVHFVYQDRSDFAEVADPVTADLLWMAVRQSAGEPLEDDERAALTTAFLKERVMTELGEL
jgi:hypothetical protein